ncbi:nitrile hydratase subunit alpha, partial [Rhizobium ruizarguesonis]
VFNTPDVHNLIVCTLCSCYPLSILGMSPSWYRSTEYRARAVRNPRGVLQEFGIVLPESVEIRVWDSTSDRLYMVIPQRPEATGGWTEE